MSGPAEFSKREVARAGKHLAERLTAARAAERDFIVDLADPADARARDAIEWWRSEHAEPMLAVYDVVEAKAPALFLGDEEEIVAVTFRSKRFDTIVEKLTREPGKVTDMVDIGGVRAVVDNQNDVDELHERLATELDVKRLRDWARAPRSTGYRAVHLHVRQADRMIEVQLRTFGQDAWANLVEEESRLSGVNYKAGFGDQRVVEFFRLIADMYGAFELGESHPDVAKQLYDLYPHVKPMFHLPLLQTFDQ